MDDAAEPAPPAEEAPLSDTARSGAGGIAPFAGTRRFEIEGCLGAGGMGVVYLAHDRDRGMRVALKTLQGADPANLARLKREFRSLADVAHPGLVSLYELFADEGKWFFTMEAIDGVRFDAYCARVPSLGEADLLLSTRIASRITRVLTARRVAPDEQPSGERLAAVPPVAPETAVTPRLDRPIADLDRLRASLEQLTDAVEALHRAGMLHCDLKPSNVLVTKAGRVAVLDFGLVRPRPREGAGEESVLEGTPQYLAPELLTGAAPGPPADWYGVGVMVFQALTGRLPVVEGHYALMLAQKLIEDAPRVSSLADGIPEPLDALVAGLLHRDPGERLGASAIRAFLAGDAERGEATSALAGEPAFVGRAGEMSALEAHFVAAAAGEPRFVMVRGPSGIGKSAVLRHFGESLARDGRALVLQGRCYEREEVPFKALDSVVDALAAHLARLPGTRALPIVPENASALTVLFPVLGAVDAIAALPPPDAALDPAAVRALAADAIRTMLSRLGERSPVVIVVDDLQWGDLDSASFLSEVIDPRSRTRLLFLASVRSEARESEVVRAIRAHATRVFDLDVGPLDAASCVALAESVLGPGPRADGVAREAGGLPFFAVELSRWASRDHGVADGGGAPTSIEGVIAAGVASLPVDARALLELSSVAGVPVPASVLARAAGLASDPLPALRLLGARSLLRASAVRATEVEPYHDRVREVVSAGLEAAHRTRLHARLGAALVEHGDADPETVARHLALAGDRAGALPFLLRAAERSSRSLAFDHAVSLYEQALLLAAGPDRASISMALAEALVLAGRSADAAPLFAAEAQAARTESARAHASRRAAEEWLKCGRIDEGVAALRGVLTGVGLRYPDSQAEALARAVVRIVRIRRTEGVFVERDERDVPKAVLARVDAGRAAGTGLMLVDPLRGYGFLARFLLDALAAGEPRRVAAGLSLNAVTLCRGGEPGYAKAKRWLERSREIAERLDDDYLRGLADACESGASVTTGRWKVAARLGLAAPSRLRRTGTPATWECTAAASLARSALYFSGDLVTLRPEAAKHLRAAEQVGDRFAATYARVHGWFAAAMDDDLPRGRADLADALARWSQLGFHAMHFWALYGELQYDLYEGRPEAGLARLDAQRKNLARSRILAMQFYRIFLAATEANLRVALGAPKDLALASKLAKTLDGEKTTYASAYASLVRARVAEKSGQRSDALRESVTAVRLFEQSEMALHAAAARALHGALVPLRVSRSASGGDPGKIERAGAIEVLGAQGIRSPERWLRMLGATD